MIELGVLNEEAASSGLTRKHIIRGRVPKPRGGEGRLCGTTNLVLEPTLIAEPLTQSLEEVWDRGACTIPMFSASRSQRKAQQNTAIDASETAIP